MKTLNVKQRLEFALCGVDQLRKLGANKTKMRFEAFGAVVRW